MTMTPAENQELQRNPPIQIWEVGGCVRDRLLGVKTNDIDYTVIAPSYAAMKFLIENTLYGKIWQEREEFLTIRAGIPDLLPYSSKMVNADFVLARKDGLYTDGRHPDTVTPGTLKDDLDRRDFTINAIARNPSTGELEDPHNGRMDLENGVIRAVGNAHLRFAEDGLRLIRAIRFKARYNFSVSDDIDEVLRDEDLVAKYLDNVHPERIRTELEKMLHTSTFSTWDVLIEYPHVGDYMFKRVNLRTAGIVVE